MFTPALQDSLKLCVEYAEKLGNAEIYSEHLLYALLDNAPLWNALGIHNDTLEAMKRELLNFLEKAQGDKKKISSGERHFSKNCQKLLEKGIFWGKTSGYLLIEGWHVLIAMLSEPKSFVYHVLSKRNVTQKRIFRFFMLQDPFHGAPPAFRFSRQSSTASASEAAEQSIDSCLTHLTDPAISKSFDPVIGRSDELERIAQILCRRKKNNPLLVGEAGVGKTAIIEGLARQIFEGKVTGALKSAKIYSLDVAALLSGTKYRGDLELRFRQLITRLERIEKGILAIDEVHLIVGAGSSSGGNVDLANLLKPLMTSGKLRIIGATTYQEYQHFIEKDKALTRRFQLIPVPEPTPGDALKILRGVQARYEAHHNVKYSNLVLESIVNVSSRVNSGHAMPDKALDLLDELGSSVQMNRKSNKQKIICAKDLKLIEQLASTHCKFTPLNAVNAVVSSLEKKLKARIFGQDQAISELVTLLKLSKSGLRPDNKPMASILISGTAGTGKTAFALAVANILEIPLLRLDMSEYAEPQTISRLLGAPPGYIGNDRGGLLTDAVLKRPNTLILVDELEKAHPDVLNLFLQIMDGGSLTDANGRKISFFQTLLIMTSNLGATALEKTSIGFQKQSSNSESLKEVKNTLSPEFRSRLDRILVFAPLTEAVELKILNYALGDLALRLKDRHGLKLQFTQAARQWIIKQFKHSGARKDGRQISRWVEQVIQLPISEELISKKFEKGDHFLVDVRCDQLEFLLFRKSGNKRLKPSPPSSQDESSKIDLNCFIEKA